MAKERKDPKRKPTKFLIVIKVFGSSWPIRFIVNGDDSVNDVIKKTLKHYARQGRLPVLGSHSDEFYLCAADSPYGLSPEEEIGGSGSRIFALHKKHRVAEAMNDYAKKNKWRSWLSCSPAFQIPSH